MKTRPTILRGLAGAAAALLLAAGCGPRSYQPTAAARQRERLEERIARVLVDEAQAAVKKPARVAVVRAGPDSNFGDEHTRILAVLSESLASEKLPLAEWVLPNRPAIGEGYAPAPTELTGAWLEAKLRETPGVEVIISLADAPVGDPSQLPPGLPPLVCLAPLAGANVGPMMRAGAVKAAIVPRRTEVPKGEKDWFDIRFAVVHPDTVAAWEKAASAPQ